MPIKWKDTAELIGIAAIVASLIFVGLQIQQDFGIARSQVWSERNMVRAELAALISEYSDTWAKGLNGDELSKSEVARFEAIFIVYLFKESTHFLQRDSGISPGRADGIAYMFANMVMSYPGLRSTWARWIASRNVELPRFAIEVQRQLDEMKAGRIEHIQIEMLVPY